MEGSETRKEWVGKLLLLFSASSLRFLYYGAQYFPQLDDYIQYHNYATFPGPKSLLIKRLGLLGARPLAGLFDIFVWSHFWPNLVVAVLLLSLAYSIGALLLYRLFRRHFGSGNLFLVVLCLVPLGFEGLYWVSASSRIACGFLFAALSAWFWQMFADDGRPRHLVLFAAFGLVACCFYEQAMLLFLALVAWLTVTCRQSLGRRAFWSLLAPADAAVYFFLTSLLSGSGALYGTRTELAIPNNPYYFKVFLPELVSQIRRAFVGAGWGTIALGWKRGLAAIASDRNVVYVLCAVAVSAAFFLAERRNARASGKSGTWTTLFWSAFLAASPVVPFFFIANPWFSLRSTVMSYAGIALLADFALRAVASRVGSRESLFRSITVSIVAFAFLVASVSELHDYKLTREQDVKIVGQLHEATATIEPDSSVALLGLRPSYLPEVNYSHNEHIHGVTESDWALSGALEAMYGRHGYQLIPISPTHPVYPWYDRLDFYDEVLLYDEAEGFVFLQVEELGGGEYRYYDREGHLRAAISRDDQGQGILKIGEE